MAMPTIIQGPAVVTHDTYDFYTQGNVTINYRFETWDPVTAAYGKIGARMRSKMAEISFTPAGMYTAGSAAKYWPKAQTNVGASIFNGTVVVAPLTGNKITFARGGITRWPALKLSPLNTTWQEMTILALGDNSLAPTNAAHVQTIAA